ncbi:potassium channel family protein [Butyrivibrio sp. AE2032]|uniref:potassium channel family protein n=1 Tax=Butyrivibrio sp. AE2032 TaxID=1458463 RepID=UPI00054D8853|nr:TrkA family potassium uptake protein [Butyrivibrio sp. AE2032]
MKSILVVGIGRFGYHLIDQLNKAGDEILAVDSSEERLEPVLGMVTSSLIGDATNESFVRSLGVENFDVCFVAIGDDFQSSLEATSLLKECGAKYVVARASRLVHEKFLLRNGADFVVFPEKQLAEWSAIRWCSGRVVDYLDFPGEYSIFEITVPKDWIGKSLAELGIRNKLHLNVLSIKRDGKAILEFPADLVFETGDTVTIFGADKDIQKSLKINY